MLVSAGSRALHTLKGKQLPSRVRVQLIKKARDSEAGFQFLLPGRGRSSDMCGPLTSVSSGLVGLHLNLVLPVHML